MSYRVRYTKAAREDLTRLHQFLLQHDPGASRATIIKSMDLLKDFPFTCRKASADTPFLRELFISFGASGYVALFEIEDPETVTILAIRHQREDDFY